MGHLWSKTRRKGEDKLLRLKKAAFNLARLKTINNIYKSSDNVNIDYKDPDIVEATVHSIAKKPLTRWQKAKKFFHGAYDFLRHRTRRSNANRLESARQRLTKKIDRLQDNMANAAEQYKESEKEKHRAAPNRRVQAQHAWEEKYTDKNIKFPREEEQQSMPDSFYDEYMGAWPDVEALEDRYRRLKLRKAGRNRLKKKDKIEGVSL
jgi:hypothetical protein